MAKKIKDSDNTEDRYLDLSAKFMEMGNALIKEGEEKDDFVISQSGNFFIMAAGLVLSPEDSYLFGELCSMFTAKKVLDKMTEDAHPMVTKLKKKSDGESYEDFIKRINDIRRNNGLGPMKG